MQVCLPYTIYQPNLNDAYIDRDLSDIIVDYGMKVRGKSWGVARNNVAKNVARSWDPVGKDRLDGFDTVKADCEMASIGLSRSYHVLAYVHAIFQ